MPLTLVEKLATRHAEGLRPGEAAHSGDFIIIRPRHVMTHDNTGAVIPKFREIFKSAGQTPKIHDPHQPVFAIDHDIQNTTPENLGKYAKIEAFASQHAVDFYPAGTGISHQVMVEQGYVRPGSMVVGSDSHSNLYGALACLGSPVVRTDAASLWATGTTWWQVPPVARVVLKGSLRPGVVGKDVIVALCGVFNKDEVLNHAVEFAGEGIAALSIDQRMSIANMSTEWGALAGVFPFDERLREYLLTLADSFAAPNRPGVRRPGSRSGYSLSEIEAWWNNRSTLSADAGASYAAELEIDLSSIVPHVSGPNDVKTMTSLPEIEARHVKINKAWLMSCVNGRLEDLAVAAGVVRGKHVAPGVEFYVAAASAGIQRDAEKLGHWQALIDAGAIALPPGCGTCIGLGRGTIKAGEVGISATNRNFEGRMGDKNGLVYLGSPAVVAASAVNGYICSPTKFTPTSIASKIKTSAPNAANSATGPATQSAAQPAAQSAANSFEVITGFPAVVRGRAWFLDKDNLNTDGIYAGKHTYNDSMTKEQMAAVIFENYDADFRAKSTPGDVVIGGLNFGTGSSREQAATALKHFGIPCVVAASFSETYKRNAFNNGFVVFECPALVSYIRSLKSAPTGTRTIDAGAIEIDFTKGTLTLSHAGTSKSFPFLALSRVAQELVVAGGAEAVVAKRLTGK
ncbi:MAG: homoaconitase [Phycisphaerales bacterium]|jgi:homoaconitate hydratase|nr:homoaconitase [Phycisphaerales bacterium]